MGHLVEFGLPDGDKVLVEVSGPAPGPVVRGMDGGVVAERAQISFEAAVSRIKPAVQGMIGQLRELEPPAGRGADRVRPVPARGGGSVRRAGQRGGELLGDAHLAPGLVRGARPMGNDLAIEISAGSTPGTYEVKVDSPAGTATGTMHLDAAAILGRRRELGRQPARLGRDQPLDVLDAGAAGPRGGARAVRGPLHRPHLRPLHREPPAGRQQGRGRCGWCCGCARPSWRGSRGRRCSTPRAGSTSASASPSSVTSTQRSPRRR